MKDRCPYVDTALTNTAMLPTSGQIDREAQSTLHVDVRRRMGSCSHFPVQGSQEGSNVSGYLVRPLKYGTLCKLSGTDRI